MTALMNRIDSTPDAIAAGPTTASPAPGAQRAAASRDLYIDTLRGVALLRVLTYHTFGWAWLPMVYPSMGIMFALGGSLMASSLDRGGSLGGLIKRRFKRILIPFWAFAAVAVGVMLSRGWQVTEDLGEPLTVESALRWIVPLGMPPNSVQFDDWVLPLWYVAAYLWFVLLSPALLWLFRRWPKTMITAPLALVFLQAGTIIDLSGPFGDIALDVVTYDACWMLGFAHHDGLLKRIPLWKALAGAAVLAAAGIAWAYAFPNVESGANVSDIPVASALFSLGAVLLVLRCYLNFAWMHRVPPLAWLVRAVSSRALTIYLWGNAAIYGSELLLDQWSVTQPLVQGPASDWWIYGGTFVVLTAIVLAVGWIEDVAAGRRPRLVPRFSTPAGRPRARLATA